MERGMVNKHYTHTHTHGFSQNHREMKERNNIYELNMI